MKKKYDPKLNTFKDPRFLTLTLRGFHPLDRRVHERLNYAWKRMSLILRKNGYVKGYIKVTELVARPNMLVDGKEIPRYYWHLHIIYDGVYIPAEILRSFWKQYTKDSNWVHVSRVRKNFSASAYIRKYITKLVYDNMDLTEYIKVYKMKLISSYGCVDELETLIEIEVTSIKLKCPICGYKLMPEKKKKIP